MVALILVQLFGSLELCLWTCGLMFDRWYNLVLKLVRGPILYQNYLIVVLQAQNRGPGPTLKIYVSRFWVVPSLPAQALISHNAK